MTQETTFEGVAGDRGSALLVPSKLASPTVGVLFLHWGFGNRTSFLREAEAYAEAGVTSLLIDAPGFGKREGPRVPAKDAGVVRASAEQLLSDLTSGLDFICAQSGVDPSRIGFVGHSLGATIAGAFLARNPRIRAAVLTAGTSMLSRLRLNANDPEGTRSLEYLDSVRCLPRVQATLFLQFAEHDEFISRADAEAQLASAREPKTARWYACDHALDANALRDRAEWLGSQLAFGRRPVLPAGEMLPRGQLFYYRAIKPLMHVANRVRRWLTTSARAIK